MIFDMLEYYKKFNMKDMDIIYSGPVWANGLESIAGTLKKRLEIDDLPLTASQSVFSVFVEQVNNVLLYSTENADTSDTAITNEQPNVSNGLFLLGVRDKTYFVQSGNFIKRENMDALKQQIDHLNALDKSDLRKYYKERIKSGYADSRMADLGLIEIARRASSKIEYLFTPVPDGPLGEDSTFFTMFVMIG